MGTDAPNKTIRVDFAALLIAHVVDLLGPSEVQKIVGAKLGRGFLGFGSDKAALALTEEGEEELQNKIAELIALIMNAFGTNLADANLEDIYTKLEKKYSPMLANSSILPLIPDKFLEKYRLHYLSKEELEARVIEQSREVQQLKELDKRKSEFLSVVTHQLRTPLTGIKWALTMLQQSQSGPLSEVQKKLILSCEEGNERMLSIVNKMLHADRINSGTFELAPVSTDLVALISSVIEEARLAAAERSVGITFTHDAHIPALMLDPEMMRFAFQNLLDNAIKYSPPRRAVLVRAEVHGTQVVCSVADHGIGIPSEQQSYIFSRFFRAKNAISTEPNGNGLGLFIVKSILEKHGGRVWFTSEENKGTTFYCAITL
ncbi:MAG TPA: HAMP domain-containing sensor histidine kinase [Candidatus Paceibacterota bacterium]|nr:HAMP domain-containing sensor histidine kinase [Candidatus Paceibacterota bacterium]